jgi:uncharacterized protein YwgA
VIPMDLTPERQDRMAEMVAFFEAVFDRKLNMHSFSDRIRLQKIIYILKQAGLNLGYSFGWHIRGPYSPSLADDGYAYDEIKGNVAFSHNLTEQENAIIDKVKNFSQFLEDEENSELLASLLYLYKRGFTTQESLFAEIKTRKPRFSENQIRAALEVWGKIRGTRL